MLLAIVLGLLVLAPGVSWAQDTPAPPGPAVTTPAEAPAPAPAEAKIDTGDTAFVLICAALVLLMTPGLALFYGGMARRKNVLGTFMQSFIAMGIITVLWVVAGYSIAFSGGGDFMGDFNWIMLNGVDDKPVAPSTIPHQLFMVFQMMFAIITPALISGAFAERMRFAPYLVFISLWSLLVYAPLAHWVWASTGWLFKLPALDFAGGTVVHISSGVTALVACIMIGKRRNYPSEEMRPHNLTMTLLGTGLLWFGWFGFNAGSALAANGLAAYAFVNTHVAAGTAMLAWVIVEWALRGKPTALGAASGAVAGLVGITPAAGFVNIGGALAIGAITGIVCYFAVVSLKAKLGYDDSLDTFGVHGVGGTVGAILTGVFATKAVNSAGQDGLLAGNAGQLMNQFIGVGATWVYAGVVSAILLTVINLVMKLRMTPQDEEIGMDVAEHGEEGYVM
jgi:Amt family ammonium transporter